MVQRISSLSQAADSTLHGHFLMDPSTTTGLTFGYQAGQLTRGVAVVPIALGTVGLTDDATNYVHIVADAVVVDTTMPADTQYVLYEVVTASSVITSITDLRGTVV